MNKKTVFQIIGLLLICGALVIFPLLTVQNSEFGGADGQAEEVVSEINPEYEPWFENIIELPGGETETLLFCLQTGLGVGVLAYGFGYWVARKKYNNTED